ncbi:MAG: AbrB/MazE/SpoVT family DNA-binding domain-containing protein [Actinomycetota bacterium]
MKSTGIVRKLDELGRIVIPMELRRIFGISNRDPLEIFVEGDKIVLQKSEPSCAFCDSMDNLTTYKEKYICERCRTDLSARKTS